MANISLKNTIPEGYKQTEVGVIPEDWNIKPIYKITVDNKISSGLYKDKKSYGKGGVPIIKLGDVFANDIFRPSTVQKVKAEEHEVKNYQVKVGDLIIALASVKLEGVGKVMHVTNLQDKTIFDHNVALIRTNDFVNSYFLNYVFKSNYLRSMIASKATQVGTTFLKSSTILNFNIALPPLPEQTAIATALSDMDELIASLERLIAKKEAIKTGMMQQLLTGKTRLPEFATEADGQLKGFKQTDLGLIPDDWGVFKLNEHFNILAGGDAPRDSLSKTKTESYPYPIYANAIQNHGLYGYTSYKRAKPDSITITARGYLGHAEYRNEHFFPIVRLLVLEPIGPMDSKYTTYAINNLIEFSIESTGVPQLTAPQVGRYSVIAPLHIEEQTTIATILSDMDAEIQALQDRLDKTRDIKQGMMQQLLTGRVRLIDPNINKSA